MLEFNRHPNPHLSTFSENHPSLFHFLITHVVLTTIAITLVSLPVTVYGAEQDSRPVNTRDRSCSLGVFPFISAQRLESVFAPIAVQLDEVMGCSLRYRSAANFKAFKNKLNDRAFEIAFIQPFDYINIAKRQGYIPLATRKGSLQAVVVTRNDSDIRNMTDFRGKTIALPPKMAAMSYLGRDMLSDAGLSTTDDVTLLYSKNHGSCLHKVSIGQVAACITAPTTLRLFEAKNDQQFKEVARSSSIPNALFVARDDTPEEKIHQLQQKILQLSLNEDGQNLFNKNKIAEPFRIVNDSEYDIVRMIIQKSTPIK